MDSEKGLVQDLFCGGEISNIEWISREEELLSLSTRGCVFEDSSISSDMTSRSALMVVDARDMRILGRYEVENESMITAIASYDGDFVLGTNNGDIKIAKNILNSDEILDETFTVLEYDKGIVSVDIHEGLNSVICAEDASLLRISSDGKSLRMQKEYEGVLIDGSITSVKFLDGNETGIFSNIGGQIKLFDFRLPTKIAQIFWSNLSLPLAISTNPQDILSRCLVSGENGCEEWDLRGNGYPLHFQRDTAVFKSVYNTTDTRQIFHACGDGTVKMHDLNRSQPVIDIYHDNIPLFAAEHNSVAGRQYLICGGAKEYLHKFEI